MEHITVKKSVELFFLHGHSFQLQISQLVDEYQSRVYAKCSYHKIESNEQIDKNDCPYHLSLVSIRVHSWEAQFFSCTLNSEDVNTASFTLSIRGLEDLAPPMDTFVLLHWNHWKKWKPLNHYTYFFSFDIVSIYNNCTNMDKSWQMTNLG